MQVGTYEQKPLPVYINQTNPLSRSLSMTKRLVDQGVLLKKQTPKNLTTYTYNKTLNESKVSKLIF